LSIAILGAMKKWHRRFIYYQFSIEN